ncbi:MFS transporter [Chloroflexota bacterium]
MKKLGAYQVYLIMEGASAMIMSMIFTASAVYQVTLAGLTPIQLVLVGTTLELSAFIFEVPTGVIADVYSRRLSVIIGLIMIGLGFVVEGSFPIFWVILLAQVLWGLGYTFTSGATQAWITDEIGEAEAGKAFLRSSQLGQILSLLGIGAGIALGSLAVNIPIQIGGLSLILLAVYLITVMPETGFTPISEKERSTWQNMWQTFRGGVAAIKGRPGLITVLGIGLIYGLYSEGLDRLWTKHLLDNFSSPMGGALKPVVWIGMIRAVGMLMTAGATGIVRGRMDTQDQKSMAKFLFALSFILLLSLFGFALTTSLVAAVLAFLVGYITRMVIGPLYTAWVNQRLDSRVRATVLSMSSQVDAIGQVVGGPGVGLLGSLVSVRAALVASSLILSPVMFLYRRLIRRIE